jgi:hypothetical protein
MRCPRSGATAAGHHVLDELHACAVEAVGHSQIAPHGGHLECRQSLAKRLDHVFQRGQRKRLAAVLIEIEHRID